MTDHFIDIYTRRAADYHRFVSVEDVDGNLLKAIEGVTPLAGKRLLDLGTGTGRLPLLLAGRVADVIALDLHWDMLRQNVAQRAASGRRWSAAQADMRGLPLPRASADIVTAGWAIGHLRGWHSQDWQRQIGRILTEIERVAAPGGAVLIFETLTTGSLSPAPPNAELAEYYAWLESAWGYTRQAFSTDYQFASVDQAVEWTEFFFGPDLSRQIRANGWARLPEWTGLWSKRRP